MARLIEYRPKTMADFLVQVEALQAASKNALWFRGAATASHRLIPSLYRHPTITTETELQALESKLIIRFRQRSVPYHGRDLSDDWESLFFMQHYGVPTRLLDWTENPFTALYFALMTGSPTSKDDGKNHQSAAVWILDPYSWNQAALKRVTYTGGPFVPGDRDLGAYNPGSTPSAANAHPVALFGAHNSPRIVAQQGVFTIFGTSRVPMENLVRDDTIPASALSRVVIPPSRTLRMRDSLLNFGVTESTVFPDLEGLARETKRLFGFNA